jgi:hypothetical protein
MTMLGAYFGRADVARLLNIPEWTLANFADRRYPYGLVPSIRGGRGRGKKSLYTLADVYKIALAYGMFLCDLDAHLIGEAIKELFQTDKAGVPVTNNRAKDEASARYIVFDLQQVASGKFLTGVPDSNRSTIPPEWKGKDSATNRKWVALCPRSAIAEEFRHGNLSAVILVPFDELLYRVDSQLLGRKVSFARPMHSTHETEEKR